MVYCLNKIDSISIEELDLLYRIPNSVPISSEHGWNIDELMEAMWEKLNLKRVYTKPKGRAPDYSAPVVLRSNKSTVEDFVSRFLLIPANQPPLFCIVHHNSPSEPFNMLRQNTDRVLTFCRRLVQRHPPKYCGTIQDGNCLRKVRETSTAKGRIGT